MQQDQKGKTVYFFTSKFDFIYQKEMQQLCFLDDGVYHIFNIGTLCLSRYCLGTFQIERQIEREIDR